MIRWDVMLLQAIALIGVFILAVLYDGEVIWIFCVLAGGVLGINITHIWRSRLESKEDGKPNAYNNKNRWRK